MAPNRPSKTRQPGSEASSKKDASSVDKLPRLPEGSKVQKRALARRQQPVSSKSQLIYVSSGTPFMAVVSRVRKQLGRCLRDGVPPTRGLSLSQRVDRLHRDGGTRGTGDGEAVVLGTGKAVEKVLSVAAWFSGEKDCEVEVRTRSVGTVDDVVVEGEEEFGGESRVRKVSCLEVTVKLR